MTHSWRNCLLPVLLLFLLCGCGVVTDPRLVSDISRYARSVQTLAKILESHYDDTEALHRRALRDNLDLQFELGGRPEVNIRPLFQPEERSSRKALLEAMTVYVFQLSDALAGDTPEGLIQTGYQAAAKLKNLRADAVNLSHSLTRFQTRELITSLSGFSKILLLPKRNKALARISKRAEPYVRELVILFYIDIGSSRNENRECRYSVSNGFDIRDLNTLDLCEGGLRGLVKNAFEADRITWQQRLNLAMAKERPDPSERRRIIDRIFMLEQARKEEDAVLEATQAALVAMLLAHEALSLDLAIQSGEKSLSARTGFADPVSRFVAEVQGLAANRISVTDRLRSGKSE